jgi:lipoprotein-anchoring transpeptidase ErfK/SrfK
MKLRLIAPVIVLLTAAPLDAQRRAASPARGETRGCGDGMAFQVLLDRNGYSPGVIDGQFGANGSHALAAFQQAKSLPPTGQMDCPSFEALSGGAEDDVTTRYVVTDADMKGPFVDRIPAKLSEQTELPRLGYTSAAEMIAERFHTVPAVITKLNPHAHVAAGESLTVPAVKPFDASTRPAADPAAADVTLEVSTSDSALRAKRSDGSVIFFAPVTTGSEHDPLPIGTWRVTAVSWMPAFHYNPELFWDASPADEKGTIKAGPNNPVGVAWIDINVEHYGLHGTPEPSRIGHTESHGCVRLTNWDAARVAALAKVGTPVIFK